MATHTDYAENEEYWKKTRDFIKGKKEIKKYLRTLNPSDTSTENVKINNEYQAAAIYLNVPGRTQKHLTGAAFRKDPTIELPAKMEYLKENVNGGGLSLNNFSKNAMGNNVSVGRHGVLTDYITEESRAKIVGYKAETIEDWDTDKNGNAIMVKLYEGKNEEDKKIYRQLELDEKGYFQQMYLDDDKDGDPIYPTKSDNSLWDFIPFVFIGSEDNTPDVDMMPMWDIVVLAAGHYQNSADNEDHLFGLAPTLAITVPNKAWKEEMIPNGYQLGSRSYMPLPENGQALLLEPEPRGAYMEAMTQKEEQMVKVGARMIESGSAAETAEAVKIRYSADSSILDNLAQNTSNGIELSLRWAAEFEGQNPNDVKYEMTREYFDTTMTAQEVMADIQLLDSGIIAKKDLRNKLRKIGTISPDRTDEELDEEAEETDI